MSTTRKFIAWGYSPEREEVVSLVIRAKRARDAARKATRKWASTDVYLCPALEPVERKQANQ